MNTKKQIKQLNFLLNKKDKQVRKLKQSKSDILDSGIDCAISYEDLKKQLEIANSIIDRNIARVLWHLSDKPAIEMYDNTDNDKEEIIRTVPKEQYDYIKELKIMKIKTIEQAKKLVLHNFTYINGDWEYRDTEGYYHLFRRDEELLPEVKKISTNSYSNKDWSYKDQEGYYHLFRNGKELLPDIKKTNINSYLNGDWAYYDVDGYNHLIRNNKELLPEIKKKYIYSYDNGDIEYADIDGYIHLIRDGKELLPEIKKIDVFSFENGNWRYQDINGKYHNIERKRKLK